MQFADNAQSRRLFREGEFNVDEVELGVFPVEASLYPEVSGAEPQHQQY